MRIAHFYHCYASGEWEAPVNEHICALLENGFTPIVHLGLVGQPVDAWKVRMRFSSAGIAPLVAAEASKGFEQVTLAAIHAYAQEHDGAVMYAHSKGASEPDEKRTNWRRAMTKLIVEDWRVNLAELDGYDAVGMHWLTPDTCPGTTQHPFFAGNFWLARCDYLRKLPRPDPESDERMKAETWVGMGRPIVLDLMPGWPAERRWAELCAS